MHKPILTLVPMCCRQRAFINCAAFTANVLQHMLCACLYIEFSNRNYSRYEIFFIYDPLQILSLRCRLEISTVSLN